jgi:hypothetical protein
MSYLLSSWRLAVELPLMSCMLVYDLMFGSARSAQVQKHKSERTILAKRCDIVLYVEGSES